MQKVTVNDRRGPNRKAGWEVVYFKDRKAIRRYFISRELADQHATQIRNSFKFVADPAELAKVMRLTKGTGYTLVALIEAGLDSIKKSGGAGARPDMTFEEATRLVTATSYSDTRRDITIAHYKSSYKVINEKFGSTNIHNITSDAVISFLVKDLKNRKGIPGEASAATKNTKLEHIRTAMRKAGIKDPLVDVKDFPPESHIVKFLSNEQIVLLFKGVRPCDRGQLALAAFAALRPTMLGKLPADCVDPIKKEIRIPADISKDKKEHIIEGEFRRDDGAIIPGLPEVLWDWLKAYPFQPKSWVALQRRLLKIVGNGNWIHDALRHTGATNYYAFFGRKAVSSFLTHEGTAISMKHYVGTTSRTSAQEFYRIHPSQFRDEVPVTPTRRRLVWPENSVLEAMLRETAALRLEKTLGCSSAAIFKHCKVHGIRWPGRSERAKINLRLAAASIAENRESA